MKVPRASRLTKRREIERVKEEGRALRTSEILARLSSSPFPYLRVGLVVPRFGHTAVERNRLKRRLREIVRYHVLTMKTVGDLVLWARPTAYAATFDELQMALDKLRRRIEADADTTSEA